MLKSQSSWLDGRWKSEKVFKIDKSISVASFPKSTTKNQRKNFGKLWKSFPEQVDQSQPAKQVFVGRPNKYVTNFFYCCQLSELLFFASLAICLVPYMYIICMDVLLPTCCSFYMSKWSRKRFKASPRISCVMTRVLCSRGLFQFFRA
jgi:hypothetical protein